LTFFAILCHGTTSDDTFFGQHHSDPLSAAHGAVLIRDAMLVVGTA
jgi:hypothetical protein